jgi:hydrogenase maturation protein HypF
MTSGNVSEEPIAIDLEDAVARLGDIADLYLDHNREILSRCDDSVVRVTDGDMLFLRRSRGWVPLPLGIDGAPAGILACGAHLKNTIAVTRRNRVFLSQHIGDLENAPAFDFFKTSVKQLEKIIQVRPEVVAYDMHPDYLSTRFAMEVSAATRIGVQHHHAHIASCLGEAGIGGPVIGMALDGTGYGPDGTVWGCEVLVATRREYERVGHLERVGMPGGETAVRQPWRMALSHLVNSFGDDVESLDLRRLLGRDRREIETTLLMLRQGVNSPVTSSCGRLFDAVSSLCRLRDRVSYEGQAAIELEMAADERERGCYPVVIEAHDASVVISTGSLIRSVVDDLIGGADVGTVSGRFHNWVSASLVETALRVRERQNIDTVALSGGCFQNEILLGRTKSALESRGFDVIVNRLVPTNDGGISFGQAVVAAATVLDLDG